VCTQDMVSDAGFPMQGFRCRVSDAGFPMQELAPGS